MPEVESEKTRKAKKTEIKKRPAKAENSKTIATTNAQKAQVTTNTETATGASSNSRRHKKELQKKVKNYEVIQAAHSFLTNAILDKLKNPNFPDFIEGNLVYSPKYQNWPLAKARVLLQFQKAGEDDIQSAAVITDANGYFCFSVPSAARQYEKMIVDVARNGVTEKFAFSCWETVLQGGNLGNLAVRDSFYVEGIFEKVDSIVSQYRGSGLRFCAAHRRGFGQSPGDVRRGGQPVLAILG